MRTSPIQWRDEKRMNSRRIAYLGLFTALAVLMGYIEMLLPDGMGIPGFKLGLCNIVIVYVLYAFGAGNALLVSAARILVIGFLFGNLYSILYSLSGTLMALLFMTILKKSGCFSPAGVSSAGGAAHNTGQLICACALVPGIPFRGYLPPLLAAGCAAGFINGLIVLVIMKRVRPGRVL